MFFFRMKIWYIVRSSLVKCNTCCLTNLGTALVELSTMAPSLARDTAPFLPTNRRGRTPSPAVLVDGSA